MFNLVDKIVAAAARSAVMGAANHSKNSAIGAVHGRLQSVAAGERTQSPKSRMTSRAKVFLFALAALLLTETASAQRTFFINANASEVHQSFGNGASFNLNANGGWFLAENFALTGGVGFSSYSRNSYSTNTVALNAGGRFYFTDNFFAQGLLNVSKSKNLDTRTGLRLGAGYAIFLNDRVALEPIASVVIPFASDSNASLAIGGGISVYF